MQLRQGILALLCGTAMGLAISAASAAETLKLPPGVSPSSNFNGYVASGTDYLTTDTASRFDFAAASAAIADPTVKALYQSFGVINFQGTAIPRFGGADTVLQRPYDAPINSVGSPAPASAPLSVRGVNLTSTTTVDIGGQTYSLIARLSALRPAQVQVTGTGSDPLTNPAVFVAPDSGSITIFGGPGAPIGDWTFNSSFNVYLDLMAVKVGAHYDPAAAIPLGQIDLALSQSGAVWSDSAPDASFQRTAADDGSTCALSANPACDLTASLHTGLASNEVDFFPGVQVDELHAFGGDLARHRVYYAPANPPYPTPPYDPIVTEDIPEPANWALLLMGFAASGALLRRRPHRV